MKNSTIHAAIDIGTSKVCTLVGHTTSDGEMQVTGVGLVPSRGMRKGMVSNLGEVQQVVNSAGWGQGGLCLCWDNWRPH